MILALMFLIIGAEPDVQPLRGMCDEGKLTYYLNEEYVGTSRCAWKEEGTFESQSIIKMGRQRVQGSVQIAVDGDGLWTSIAMNTQRGPAEIVRNGRSAEIKVGDRSHTVELEPGSLIMEDMSPCLMSQAVLAYDHERGGKQEFPLYFLPVTTMDASLEYVETFERFVGGKQQVFRKYRYAMAPVYEVIVIVDEKSCVCMVDYPVQHGLFIREGYDALNVRDASDALLSQSEFEVIEERNTGVPMRDGIELATDIYRPDREGKSPVILVRTPYRKEMAEWKARFYARRGYVFAVQDVRGRFSSPGEWKPFVHEAEDGYDAIEWLAGQPWSDGKVGMIGGSYLGWVQWWAASEHPPHLVTIVPNVSPPEAYFNFPHECGALLLATSLWWNHVVMEEATAELSGLGMAESFELVKDVEPFKHLPVVELDEKILGKRNEHWREWVAHPDYDEYWQGLSYMSSVKELDLPVYHQSGWFDGDGIGAKLNYQGMSGRGVQKLVLGPWGHTDTDTRYYLDRHDFGPRAVVDLQKSYLRWMDRWLKGIENGIDREPRVSLFVMGRNDWLHGDSYPLEGTKMTRFYLAGNGGLTTKLPRGEDAEPDTYTYDPGDPTGANPRGRKDLLTYSTPPLEKPLTIAGPISAVLYASSSAKDTDWIVRVARIEEPDKVTILGKGIIRARFRESFSEPKLLVPGKVYEYHLDLWHTGITVGKGERLVVVVSSALFPQFSRNLNTGGHNEMETEFVTAEQTIHHDEEHPSHLLLPVIPVLD